MKRESIRVNVGTTDAYLRVAGGLLLLGLGVSRRLGGVGSILASVLGATKVAEGVTRYCPVLDVLGLHTREGTLRPEESEPARFEERLEERREHQEQRVHRTGEGATGSVPVTPAAREFPWETASEPGAMGTAGQRAPLQPGSLRKPALTRRT